MNLDLLPNCLTKEPKIDWNLSGQTGTWYYLFCGSCGADGGRVLNTYLPEQFAYYICEACLSKYGTLVGTYIEPDHLFREKVAHAMLEDYGHYLTELEVLDELQDPSSTISKLEKEKG